jgi:hypothetical protein
MLQITVLNWERNQSVTDKLEVQNTVQEIGPTENGHRQDALAEISV